MKLSSNGITFLKDREGFDPKCKLANGSWKAHYDKIAKEYDMPYGMRFDIDGSEIEKDTIWTQEKVDYAFGCQVESFEHGINKILNGIKLEQHQYDALFSFAWNIGINGFRGSTVVKDLRSGKFSDVPRAMMLWTKNKELIPRRQLEVKLWSGEYERDGRSDNQHN